MKRSKFTDSQIMAILRQNESGEKFQTFAESTISAVQPSISGELNMAVWMPP